LVSRSISRRIKSLICARELPMLSLPPDLHDAIAHALAKVPVARWLRAAQALSERYRAPRSDYARALASDSDQLLGYAALILPAAYAQLRGALAAAAARIPGWAPTTLLDLGSGPGTALWAAAAQWPTLRALLAWEREPAAIALGRELARSSQLPAVRAAHWERVDLRMLDDRPTPNTQRPTTIRRPSTPKLHLPSPGYGQTYDLVILGHVLNELAPDERQPIVNAAWRMSGGMLLIVEPGTPEGFAIVRAARDALLAEGARTIAPCAHDQPCPLERDWCHFPQRLKRPDFQRRARGAPSEWEDAKFAYAALARFAPDASIWGRVLREPTSNKAYAEAAISSREGVARYRALKRHREAFRLVKNLAWGAALDQPLPNPVAPLEERHLDEQ
jgi:ribosomal protein RSM22 (predicted rRNA methylase)